MTSRSPSDTGYRLFESPLARSSELGRSIDAALATDEQARRSEPILAFRDFGRREFLKLGVKGALAVGLAGTGFLKFEPAFAFDLSDLPPGFQFCKDQVLVNVYIMMLRGETNSSHIIKGALTRNGREGNVHTGFVRNETPLTEPAYWFAVNYYNYKFQHHGPTGMIGNSVEQLTSGFQVGNNSPMFFWAKGINMYFRTWVDTDKRYGSASETETHFLKAIFTAAGRSEGEASVFQTFSTTEKEPTLRRIQAHWEQKASELRKTQQELDRIYAALEGRISEDARKQLDKEIFILEKRLQREKLSYEKEYELTQQLNALKSRQVGELLPAEKERLQRELSGLKVEFSKALVTAWAAFWLANHYELKQRDMPNAELIFKYVEMPLRSIDPRLKVRGPPHYHGV